MKNLSIVCLSLLGFSGLAAANQEAAPIYSEVQFDLSVTSLKQIGDLGIPVDHGVTIEGNTVTLPVSQYDLTLLARERVPYRMTIPDVAKWYRLRNLEIEKADALEPKKAIWPAPPLNFKLGTYGGYLNLA
jgi:hypothetical protein